MNNKIIAPIIVSIIMIAFFLFYILAIFQSISVNVISFIFIGIMVMLITIMVSVTIERIKEINGGEEDDISKY